MPTPAIFLDRDDTIIHDPGYLSDPAGVVLLPGVADALKRLSAAGYKLVIVTNQSGIARGLLTEEDLDRIHGELRRQLASQGAAVDGIYYCPFHPDGIIERYRRDSDCRKPAPGMLQQAAKDLNLDLAASWMVGDSPRDIQAGKSAGCRTILITAEEGGGSKAGESNGLVPEVIHPDFTAPDLSEAARIILLGTPISRLAM